MNDGWAASIFGGHWHVLVFYAERADGYDEYNAVHITSDEANRTLTIRATPAQEISGAAERLDAGDSATLDGVRLATFTIDAQVPWFQADELHIAARTQEGREVQLVIDGASAPTDEINGFDVDLGRQWA